MRVLIVTEWNRGSGGAENYVIWLRDGLREAGEEVRLLTSNVGTAGGGTADYVARSSERRAAQAFLQLRNSFAVRAMKRALAEFNPEVVLVNMFANQLSPAVFGPLKQVPTVLLITDHKYVCPMGTKLLPNESLCDVKAGWVCYQNKCVGALHWLRDQPRYALIRARIAAVDRVISCTGYIQQELARHDIQSEKLLLPVPPPGLKYLRSPAADPVFVYCGRLVREKGVGLLLRAFARLRSQFPRARLRVIGVGDLRAGLESIAESLGLAGAVDFCGWLSMAQIEPKLSDAWAMVVPSIYAEPLGLVALEAIVRGVPVIASATGGLAEVVEEGVTGLLFPNNNEDALLDRMSAVAEDRVFPNHILPGDVIARVQESFSIPRHISRMRRLFAETISAVGIRSSPA